MSWSAAKTLGWIIARAPFETREWYPVMGQQLPQAERELAKAIAEGRVVACGRPSRDGLMERVPADLFRMPGRPIVVDVFGEMLIRPPKAPYEGRKWVQIEFEPREVMQAWPQPSPRPQAPQSIIDWMLTESQKGQRAGSVRKRADIVKACMDANGCTKVVAEAAYATLPNDLRLRRGRPARG